MLLCAVFMKPFPRSHIFKDLLQAAGLWVFLQIAVAAVLVGFDGAFSLAAWFRFLVEWLQFPGSWDPLFIGAAIFWFFDWPTPLYLLNSPYVFIPVATYAMHRFRHYGRVKTVV